MEPAVPLQPDDPEDSFAEDAAVHLGGAQLAVDEDDGYLLHPEAAFVGRELHLYLEGISFEAYFVQIDGLQHPAAVAHESSCGVVNGQPRDEAHILGGEIGHQHAPHGPVHHIDTAHVARADGNIRTLLGASLVEARKVLGVMAEVGVHLEDVLVAALQRPFEAGDVGSAQAQLSFALHHEEPFGEFLLQGLYDGSCAIGRTVFDDKDVEAMFQGENGTNDILNILPFVVGRDNYNAI